MGLTYLPLSGDYIRLLSILPPDDTSLAATDIICCELGHFSLSTAARTSGCCPDGGNIEFGGHMTDEFPEYLTVTSKPKDRSIFRRLGSIAKDKVRAKFRHSPAADPKSNPGVFDFSIHVGRPSLRYWKPSVYSPEHFPAGSPTRFVWGDFVALSYMWGETTTEQPEIVVNGEVHKVTVNLEAALREIRGKEWFRKREKGLKLWIDALCINEDDPAEKKVQIMRMRQIYHEAGNVLVWLKEKEIYFHHNGSAISSDIAISYLQWLSSYYRTEILESVDDSTDVVQVQQHRETANFLLKESLHLAMKAITDDDIDIDEIGWIAILYFVHNPYWRRLWIIQELAMGRHGMPILCNNRVTQWRHVRDSALIIAHVSSLVSYRAQQFAKRHSIPIPELSERPIDHIAAIAELAIHGQRKRVPHVSKFSMSFTSEPGPDATPRLRGTRLLQILALASEANCSRKEDRVYGLLEVPGIRTLAMQKVTDMTVQKIYTHFAVKCIESGDRVGGLETAKDDETMTRREVSTTTMYGKSISTQAVEKSIVAGVSYSLDILALVDGFESDSLLLPTWVPDLSAPAIRRVYPILGPWYASGMGQSVPRPTFTAGLKRPDSPEPLAVLRCQGVFVDVIDGVGAIQSLLAKKLRFTGPSSFPTVEDASTPNSRSPGDLAHPHTFCPGVVQGSASSTYQNKYKNDIKYGIASVLVAGADKNGKPIHSDGLLRLFDISVLPPTEDDATHTVELWTSDFIASSLDFIIAGKSLGSYFTHQSCPPNVNKTPAPEVAGFSVGTARQAMFHKTRGRRLAMTSDGFFGLVPMATQRDDIVAILIGHGRPVILRKALDLGAMGVGWRVIGEAYISGLMEGERAQAEFLSIADTINFI